MKLSDCLNVKVPSNTAMLAELVRRINVSGHLGGIACAGGRQSPIVFNGMEKIASIGAKNRFQFN